MGDGNEMYIHHNGQSCIVLSLYIHKDIMLKIIKNPTVLKETLYSYIDKRLCKFGIEINIL